MTQTFVIEGPLPGMNEIIAACNRNRYKYGKMKNNITDDLAWQFVDQNLVPMKRSVHVTIRWTEPVKVNKRYNRDLDNIQAGVKFLMDALVKANVLQDDSREYVNGYTHFFPEPKGKGKIEVILSEGE